MNRNANRIQPTNFYLHDAWKASYRPQRSPPRKEFRGPSYLGHHPNFLDNRQRSPSPNLPRIPYLRKDNQRHHPPPPRHTPRKPKEKRNAPRKTIPDHALMKSLLGGHEDLARKDLRTSPARPKSTGNIPTPRPDLPPDKPSKSNADISEMPPIQFRKGDDWSEISCSECIREKRGTPPRRKDRSECIREKRGTPPRRKDREIRPRLEEGCTCCPECLQLQGTPKNLVAQRRLFFESQMKPNRSKEVTEIYRNLKNGFSTSTLSKGSSGVPPSALRTVPRTSDLFNTDFSFNSSSKRSLIESIRLKIFSNCADGGGGKVPRFPRETRQAMSIILSNRNSNLSCRVCHGKLKGGEVADVETQTTPVASLQKFWTSATDVSKMPCVKNLLCERGLHAGDCEEKLRRKVRVVCPEDCVCRNETRSVPLVQLVFPRQELNKESSRRSEAKSSDESLLGFLRSDLEGDGLFLKNDGQCDVFDRVERSSSKFENSSQIDSLSCRLEGKSSEKSLKEIFKCDLEDEGRSRTNSKGKGNNRGKVGKGPCKMSFG